MESPTSSNSSITIDEVTENELLIKLLEDWKLSTPSINKILGK